MNEPKLDPIVGMGKLFDALAQGGVQRRPDTLTDEIGEITVDTCCAFDTGVWETGVQRDGTWYIVEQYQNAEAAQTGHAIWVSTLTLAPHTPLDSIDVWDLL